MNIWVVEENDREDGPNDEWYPLEGSGYLHKSEALQDVRGRRQYFREARVKKSRVRVSEYVRADKEPGE